MSPVSSPVTSARARSASMLILRLGLGGVLAVAGALKLRDPAAFALEIVNFRLLPGLAPYLAAALPVLEVVLGVGLVVLPLSWRRAAAAAALALLVMFSVAVASAYFRHINIACGCFGGGGDAINGLTLLRNLALLGAATALLAGDRPRRPAAASPSSPPA
jgi:uncharacterized membrane protein YphA (DoxX/SURF4 family)